MDGPEDAEEEECVVDEECVPGPGPQVRPRDEQEVDHEDHVERGLGRGTPVGETEFPGRHRELIGAIYLNPEKEKKEGR